MKKDPASTEDKNVASTESEATANVCFNKNCKISWRVRELRQYETQRLFWQLDWGKGQGKTLGEILSAKGLRQKELFVTVDNFTKVGLAELGKCILQNGSEIDCKIISVPK